MFDYNITLRGCISYITESLGVSVQFNAQTGIYYQYNKAITVAEGSTQADNGPSATLPLLTPPPPPRGVWVPSGGIEDFIRTLYQNILDRDPESQTVVNLWTGQTYRHGLAYTIGGFFMSDEYTRRALPKEVTAEKFYLAVLGRQAEPAGLLYCYDNLVMGISLRDVAGHFIGSDEYRQKVQAGTAPHPIHWP